MRNRWDHESPEGHQDRPRDNTSRYVYAQVSRWLRTDEHVHPEIAMEIAAWYHGPNRLDTAITAFASHGEVKINGVDGWESDSGWGPDLSGALRHLVIYCEHCRQPHCPEIPRGDRAALSALRTYVDEVEEHATRYRRSIWQGGGHRWMDTGTVDVDSCLTCGAEGRLQPDSTNGDYGSYHGGNGELIAACTGRTDLVHGPERHCEADGGRGCAESLESGVCAHTDHECNCLLCN